ncbi:hypothetical protein D3C87_124890 [compost metagenome]
MDRSQLIAQAKAKHQREQLIAQAKQKYEASQGVPEEVIQEMPEWLSTKDRLIAKNFAQSDEKQIEFLKQKYPGADVRIKDGQIQLKQPSETSFRVLDPATGPFSKDFLHDAGDVLYDVGSGAIEGIATGLGAIGGAAATAGWGAIPGAMAASGATSAGMEGLRQKLGQSLGIPQEVDGTDVAISGGMGAVSPLLFGAGKPTAGMVSKLAKQVGASPATLEAAEHGGRGIAERGWDMSKEKIFPKLGELVSGKSADSVRAYADNIDTIDGLEKTGVTDYLNNVTDKVQKSLSETQTRLGKNVQTAIDSADLPIDVTKAKNSFQDRISFLESKPDLTQAEAAEVSSLKATYQKYFGLSQGVAPDESVIQSDKSLKGLYSNLDEEITRQGMSGTAALGDRVKATQIPDNSVNSGLMGRTTGDINTTIADHADLLQTEAQALSDAYSNKNQTEVQRILKAIEARRSEVIKANTRTEIPNQIDAGRAFDLQKKLKQAASFETNMTPETLSAKGSARGAYSAINESFDSVSDQIPQAKADYAKWKSIESELGSSFDSPQKTYNTLTSLDSKGRTILKERLKKMADGGDLDVTQDARVLQAYRDWANPSMIPVGLQGATSTSRTIPLAMAGGAAGTYLGNEAGGPTGAGIGAAAGAAAGGMLGSPAMIKRVIKANRAVEKAAKKIQPKSGVGFYANPAFTELATPWLLMNTDDQ